MWKAVKAPVEKQLREHSDYKLVLTGAYARLELCVVGPIVSGVFLCIFVFRKG